MSPTYGTGEHAHTTARAPYRAVPGAPPEAEGPGEAEGPPEAEEPAVGAEGVSVPTWRERVALAVRERTPLWLQTRCGLEGRSVAALAVLLLAAAVLAGGHFWSGRTEEVEAPRAVGAELPAADAPTARNRCRGRHRTCGARVCRGPPRRRGLGAARRRSSST